ncbi:MAG: oligosaccharide repeat unit polymerase [Chthoniobacteraceae bacterium]
MVETRAAVIACIWAYAGMAVGRHLIPVKWKNPFQKVFQEPVPSSVLFSIFWACVIIGYLNMLIAVKFNIVELVEWFMQPRFTQPWQRGRLGDWKAMLYELSMLLYLVPPLGGILVARRARFSKFQVSLVLFAVLFTLFYGFSSGTRNIFASYLVTFLIGYCFAANRQQSKEIAAITIICAVAMVASTKIMLDFRDVGFEDYIMQGYYKQASHTAEGQSLAVDNNLYAISRMTEYFPQHHAYTGFEIPYLALIHPIPRVLWPGKPDGMSITVEDIFSADGYTIATSVVGEEYMMHGDLAVFLMSAFFGACCAWWNLLASPKNTEFGILIYASGFFSVVITMRSMNWFSTALLPTLAGLVLGYIFLWSHNRRQRARPPVRQHIAPPRP